MDTRQFCELTEAEILRVLESEEPWRYSPVEDEQNLAGVLLELSEIHVEYLLACYRFANMAPPIGFLAVLLGSNSKTIRSNALNGLFWYSSIPEEILGKVRIIASSAGVPMPPPLIDTEPSLARTVLSHFGV